MSDISLQISAVRAVQRLGGIETQQFRHLGDAARTLEKLQALRSKMLGAENDLDEAVFEEAANDLIAALGIRPGPVVKAYDGKHTAIPKG